MIMKLQIALDTLTIDECIKLLDEVKDYVDIVEVGTPFLLEEGNKPVRVFKERYPQLDILADTKIMDAGELEASGAFKAGADIVTVLGVTNDETIIGALKAAKTYGGKVMIDMVCVKDLAKRVQEVDAIGVDYICCHTAFDVQGSTKSPLDDLIIINANVTNAKSAIAGGVKLESLDPIVDADPEVIIVGGAISNADDRAAMARTMKERMK